VVEAPYLLVYHRCTERIKMLKQRIRKKVDRAKEARRRARETVGAPPAERVIPDKRRKPPRHKKHLIEEDL
jgi:hypothetical protein